MTLPAGRPPAAVEEPAPTTEVPETPPRPTTAQKLGIEDRSWVLFAVVVAFIVLAFAGMIVLTALGGGSTYVPWGE
jgi:hypothetical protein